MKGDKVVEDFGDYARICYILFGDRVKYWITINEPANIADRGYANGQLAPGVSCGGALSYVNFKSANE